MSESSKPIIKNDRAAIGMRYIDIFAGLTDMKNTE